MLKINNYTKFFGQNGLEGSEIEPKTLLLTEETTHRSRQKSVDWNEAKVTQSHIAIFTFPLLLIVHLTDQDAVNMFSSKATALSKR